MGGGQVTEAEVLAIARRQSELQFPKTCSGCGMVFQTFAAYLGTVNRVGPPISYDVARGEWEPIKPVGIISHSNCSCGTTLSITSRGMARRDLLKLMRWARLETKRRGIDMPQVLAYIRATVDAQVLAESTAHLAAK